MTSPPPEPPPGYRSPFRAPGHAGPHLPARVRRSDPVPPVEPAYRAAEAEARLRGWHDVAARVAGSDRDAYVTAYAELHELVRRFLAGDANRRTLDLRHAEVELDLRRALGVPPTEEGP